LRIPAATKKALEPYIRLAPFFGIGLAVVAAALAWIMLIQRGSQLELNGSILKVRTLPLDEKSAAAILDFRISNPSRYTFVVRKADTTLVDRNGNVLEGEPISDMDARRLFEYYPILGQKYNDSLIVRTKIAPRQTMDRMLAVRFEVPEQELQARKQLRIHVEDLDGPFVDLVETRR
jgi:hypothetical protein